ncbi:MAG: protein kinase family protein, partial [Nocardioidaceae bacterium]
MEGQAIQPGSILAGRYRIDDLVGEAAGSTTWRAFDQILNRSVSIRAVASDDPRRAAFLEAARRSTAVSDPRFLPVLDAVPDEDGIAYVVREWSRGLPLSVILREGPLPSQRGATIVAEVAEALAYAHEAGMPHRAINPSTVLVKDNGAVRITGLGTEYALRAAAPAPSPDAADDPAADAAARHAGEQVDVRALGRVLYACLVARWPGGRGFG